ncbi:flippase [Sphingomonas sp.]|uniref:flippase n=1 Tax=Sphingomonas sp. TaxID=28214 RepID=UPI0025D738BD|nr:flippase [Sphingomonas sp.]
MAVNKRLVTNIASMTLWQVGNYLVPLLTYPFLTRVLDVRGYGQFTFSFGIIAYFVLITDWGFGMSASAEVAQNRDDPARISEIFWGTMATKLMLAVGCIVVLGILTLVVPDLGIIAPILFAASGLIIANLITVFWCLQGLEQLGFFAVIALVCRVLVVPATFLLVHGPADVWIAALVQAAGALLAGIASLELLRRQRIIGTPVFTNVTIVSRMKSSWHLFLAAASANLYTTTNIVVVGTLLGPVAAGIYTAADRLRAAAQNVIQPISQAAYPRSCRLMAESPERAMQFARKILAAQASITVLVTTALFFGAPLIIHILAGPRYAASVAVLQILALSPLLVGISDTLGVQVMLPLGLRKSFSQIRLWAGLFNVAMVVALTLWLGVWGTAIGTIIAELYILGAMTVAVRRRNFRFFPPRPARPVAAEV